MNSGKIIYDISSDCLRDESRLTGCAESISFPSDESEIIDILKFFYRKGIKITVQGGKTGITGGSVPFGGHIMNLSRMNAVGHTVNKGNGCHLIFVQPGVVLNDLQSAIACRLPGSFFPTDPTETTAFIGGMAACNSSGARSYRYGAIRNHIYGMRVVTPDGSVISVHRGVQKAAGKCFSLTAENGKIIKGCLPAYDTPEIKSSAGYYSRNDMDLIDLFIGSEGTLGIISEIEIGTLPKPVYNWSMMMLFRDEDASLYFTDHLKTLDTCISAIEFFDAVSLGYIRSMLQQKDYLSAIYTEIEGDSEEVLMDAVLMIAKLAETYGAGDDDTIFANTPVYFDRLKKMRHAIPESINTAIDMIRYKNPEITKLSTDMAAPAGSICPLMDLYRKDLAENDLTSAIFGHIGNNHLHVNILPHTNEEYERGSSLCLKWAGEIVRRGGTVSAEHGIGKLKKSLLEIMYGTKGIAEMRGLKLMFDPDNLLNKDNLF